MRTAVCLSSDQTDFLECWWVGQLALQSVGREKCWFIAITLFSQCIPISQPLKRALQQIALTMTSFSS